MRAVPGSRPDRSRLIEPDELPRGPAVAIGSRLHGGRRRTGESVSGREEGAGPRALPPVFGRGDPDGRGVAGGGCRLRDPVAGRDAGSALVELIGLGVVLLLPLVYVILGVLAVQQGAYGATAAARSAGRAYMLAPAGGDATGAAERAATVALADEGLVLQPGQLRLSCATGTGDCRQPGGSIRIEVRIRVALPLFGDRGGRTAIGVDGASVSPYGSYRADS